MPRAGFEPAIPMFELLLEPLPFFPVLRLTFMPYRWILRYYTLFLKHVNLPATQKCPCITMSYQNGRTADILLCTSRLQSNLRFTRCVKSVPPFALYDVIWNNQEMKRGNWQLMFLKGVIYFGVSEFERAQSVVYVDSFVSTCSEFYINGNKSFVAPVLTRVRTRRS
jgi:hypothetical protein